MTVVEIDLYGVVADLGSGIGARLRFVHGEKWRGGEITSDHGAFFGAFVVAGGTRAFFAEVGKFVVAGVSVGPGDVDAGAGFDVDFDGGGFLALVDGCGHRESSAYRVERVLKNCRGRRIQPPAQAPRSNGRRMRRAGMPSALGQPRILPDRDARYLSELSGLWLWLQQSPGGMGLPWGQVVGWPRKLQMRSSSSGEMMCSNLQA